MKRQASLVEGEIEAYQYIICTLRYDLERQER